jgi:hypothetical protein
MYFEAEFRLPLLKRKEIVLIWELDGKPLGFSSVNKIIFGREAYMHLHILREDMRNCSYRVACVMKSAALYFDTISLMPLFYDASGKLIRKNIVFSPKSLQLRGT